MQISIVAVHGLNGHSEETWTAGNSINWLYHLLPHDLPNARIMTWGYDASTDSRSRVSCLYLYNHAKTLVSDLCLERELTEVLNELVSRGTMYYEINTKRLVGARLFSLRTV